ARIDIRQRFKLIDILSSGLSRPGIELNDAKILAAAAIIARAFIDERVLQDAVKFAAVGADSESFKPAVALPPADDCRTPVHEIEPIRISRKYVRGNLE